MFIGSSHQSGGDPDETKSSETVSKQAGTNGTKMRVDLSMA
jgi:hypothetical protein